MRYCVDNWRSDGNRFLFLSLSTSGFYAKSNADNIIDVGNIESELRSGVCISVSNNKLKVMVDESKPY